MKRPFLLRIVVLFIAILLVGGYVGYRAWSASRKAQDEKPHMKPTTPHLNGTKSFTVLPPESVEPAKPAAPELKPSNVFHGSKSAPMFEPPAKKEPPQRAQQQSASPRS